mmetsp:Transcript_30938/g.100754  ORF Transcript_30938/g.100754 Transcript_30938/m.100754 type:complete len:387 (+) Transcript_30938:12-1172(+)
MTRDSPYTNCISIRVYVCVRAITERALLFSELCEREVFEDGCVGGASALADGEESEANAPASHLPQERRRELCARRPQRVPQRDRSAVHIQTRRVRTDGFRPRHGNARERFVHFVQANIPNGESGAFERFLGRGDGSSEHRHRVRRRHRHLTHARERRQPILFERRFAHDEHRCSAVRDLRRGPRGEPSAVRGREGLELRERRLRRPRTHALVCAQERRHLHELVRKGASRLRPRRSCVALRRERVELFARERTVALRHDLRALELRKDDARAVLGLDPGGVERGPELAVARSHVRGDGDDAHHLDAARDDDVLRPRQHRLRRLVQSLLRRAALPVARRPGAALGQERAREDHPTGDVERLRTNLGYATKDDVLHIACGKPRDAAE